MKNEIIKILEESKTEIKTDTWYGEVIEDHNFDLIAEKLVKLFCQHDVIKNEVAVCENDCDGVPKYCEKCYEIESQFRQCY
jgi:hypothetical protein